MPTKANRFVAALVLMISACPAFAHDRNRAIVVAPTQVQAYDPIQGVGCYWARQRVLCSRYCFWQPDGRRYCVEHERHARREHIPVYWALPGAGRPMK